MIRIIVISAIYLVMFILIWAVLRGGTNPEYRPGYDPVKRGYVPKPAPPNVRPPKGRSGTVKEKTE